MKNFAITLLLVFCLTLSLSLSACGSNGQITLTQPTTTTENSDMPESKEKDISLKMVDDIGVEITKSELVSESFPDYGTYHTVKFKIKNNTSDKIRDVSISAIHYDKNDDIISAGGGFVSSAVLEPGQSTYLNYSIGYSTGDEGVKRVSFNEINYTRGEEYTANKDMSTKFEDNSFVLED